MLIGSVNVCSLGCRGLLSLSHGLDTHRVESITSLCCVIHATLHERDVLFADCVLLGRRNRRSSLLNVILAFGLLLGFPHWTQDRIEVDGGRSHHNFELLLELAE